MGRVIIFACLGYLCAQMVSYLLDLPGKDEEDEERPEINTADSLWGETGTVKKKFNHKILWYVVVMADLLFSIQHFTTLVKSYPSSAIHC